MLVIHTLSIVGGALCAMWILTFFNNRLIAWIMKEGMKKKDRRLRTIQNVTLSTGSAFIIVIAGTMILKEFSVDPGPILASAGVVGLAVGFGAQTIIKDMLAGFFILVENQFSEGDEVKLDEIQGVVERLTLRKAVIRDTHNTLHHIPHGQVKIVSVISSEA